jgi:hypothetical protein
MNDNPFMYVAEKVKEINNFYKEKFHEWDKEKLEENVRQQVIELHNYATKNGVPLILNPKEIFINIHDMEAGEIEEDEYEESDEYSDDDDYDDDY